MHCCKFTGRCRGYIPFFSLQNFVGSGHQVLESIATNELARYDPQPSQILICGDQPSSSFHSPHALTLTSSSWRCLWTIVQDKWFRIIVILCTALRLSLVLDPKTHRVRKNGFVFLFFFRLHRTTCKCSGKPLCNVHKHTKLYDSYNDNEKDEKVKRIKNFYFLVEETAGRW